MSSSNVLRAALALGAVSLAACSSGNTANTSSLPPIPPGAPAYPAFKPAVPQLERGPVPVMSRPIMVPIFLAKDPLLAPIERELTVWTIHGRDNAIAALSEYGVDYLGLANPIELARGEGPSSASSAAIQTWLGDALDGSYPEFGPVDAKSLASRIFVGFLPEGAQATIVGGAAGCADFQAYDAGFQLRSGAIAHYVVVPRCAPPLGVVQAEWTAKVAISAVLNRIGNPVPALVPSASQTASFDPEHAGFSLGGAGLAQACGRAMVGIDGKTMVPVNGPLVPRIWSNAAAAAYEDPCVPAPLGPYFVSVPVVKDVVTLPNGQEGIGVLVPVGGSRTIDVQLLSNAPTERWMVWTQLLDVNVPRGGTTGFSFSWDTSTGNNGDTLHLTIEAPNPPRRDVVAINSIRGERQTFWLLPIESR
jgi:hypothetical protein